MTLQQCQAVADALRPGITLDVARGRVHLSWANYRGESHRYRWDAPEGSHFPTWSNKFPPDGTLTTAFDLLIRRFQGKPSVPLGTWRYLIDGPAKLASVRGTAVITALVAAGWPEEVPCILCGKTLTSCGDWWTVGEKGKRNRKSGPAFSKVGPMKSRMKSRSSSAV